MAARRRSASAGADLAITWLNDKARPLCRAAGARARGADHRAARRGRARPAGGGVRPDPHPLGQARHPDPFDRLRAAGGSAGRLLDCSAEGFAKAMDVSCHSFVRMAKLAAPLMTDGGTMFAMSYYGANRVVPNYNVMGPVKAALEAACRYLAYELGPRDPGPRHFARAAQDPGRVGHQGFRAAAERGRAEGAARRAGRHRRRGLGLRLSRHPLRPPHHRRHHLCRRRRNIVA